MTPTFRLHVLQVLPGVWFKFAPVITGSVIAVFGKILLPTIQYKRKIMIIYDISLQYGYVCD